ncbi:MAG: hypothetical protein PUP93_11530 [Rhizonema sp. NSF051]|nr:hypothetical protein [Rhizonema sp. NSF051]
MGEGTAGNLTVNSRRVTLKDRGEITAATNAVDGGNITLNTNLLLLRNGGNISATAGQTQGAGNGGNITINARVIAAVPQENSDISANAFQGRGGSVTINSDGLFGIVAAIRSTPLSDITASSELGINGTVQITTPEVDESLGLVTLPTITENTPRLVSSSCAAFADQGGSKFTVTGRSGLPPSPDEFLTSDVVWTDTRLPDTTVQQHISKKHIASPSKAVEILPATGWVLNGNGDITLISNKSGANIGSIPTNCPK